MVKKNELTKNGSWTVDTQLKKVTDTNRALRANVHVFSSKNIRLL